MGEKYLQSRVRKNSEREGGGMNKTVEQNQSEWLHSVVREITDIAKFLGTNDMHLAGIIYLASIVRRRKRKHFTGVEVHRGESS